MTTATFNLNDLAVKTAENFLDDFIRFIEGTTTGSVQINKAGSTTLSKRKDGLSEGQAGSIFAHTNAFFTLKWPHVIALILSPSSTSLADGDSDKNKLALKKT